MDTLLSRHREAALRTAGRRTDATDSATADEADARGARHR
jgi:hypothetical protein